MAKAFHISNNVAKAMLDAFTTALNAGTTPVIRIYDGAQPADVDTAITTQTLLATCNMSATSFGAAADATGKARITANTISDDSSIDASGTASWFRMYTDAGGTAIADGSVGTASADLIVQTTGFVAAGVLSISAFTIDLSET